MKILMLCREPRLYSCQRLKESAEARGFHLDILDPNRFVLKLSEQGQLALFYQKGERYLGNETLVEVADYTAILPRFGTSSTAMGCRVLRHFEAKGVTVLNNANAFEIARDKWRSLQQLATHQIAVPKSSLSGELVSANLFLAKHAMPCVIKTLSGSQGVGVTLAEQKHSAVSLLEILHQAKITSLTQDFIQEAIGQDIRAFVIGDQVVASMQRIGQAGEFRANIHQGGRAEAIQLSEAEKQLALRASRAIGLEVAGVDLIRSKQGLLVLEVNASPGLEMIEKVSKVDIAGLMLDHLVMKAV